MDLNKIHQTPEQQLAHSSEAALAKHDETRTAIQGLHQSIHQPTGVTHALQDISNVLDTNHEEGLRKLDEIKSASLIANRELKKISTNTEREQNGQGIEVIRVVGPKGDKGDKGDQGVQGIQGFTGADSLVPGPKGDKGDQGPSGMNGLDGLHGMNGAPGLNGIDGKDGSPDTPEIIVEKLESLPIHLDYLKLKNLPELYDPTKNPIGIGGGANALKILNNGTSISDYITALDFQGSATYSNNGKVTISGGGAVSSVSNANGSLIISPTTGAVVASLNLGNANIWTTAQSFSAGLNVTTLMPYGSSSISMTGNTVYSGGSITGVGNINNTGWFPSANSTTAYIWYKSDLATPVLTLDTTNSNFILNANSKLVFTGATSGLVTIQPASVAGTWSMTLPTNAGTNTYVLQTNGSGVTSWVSPTTLGPISSVSNSDTTLTISPTTGAVVASLNLAKANTWSALQTFSSGISSPSTKPSADSTTAFRLYKANGTTTLLNVNSVDGIYTFNTTSSSNRTGYFYVNNSNSNSLFGVFEGYDPLKYVGWNAAPGSTIGIGADYPTDGTNAAARIDIWGTSGVFVHGSLYPSSDVTIARVSDATSIATQQYSNPLNLQASLWNGTTAVPRIAIIQNRASTTLQGISFLTFSIQDVNAGQIEVMTLRNDNGYLGFNQGNPQYPVSFGNSVIQKKVAIYDNGLGNAFYGFGLTAGAVIVTANDTAVAWFSNNAGGSLGIHNAAPGAFIDIGGSVATGTVSVEDDFYVTRSTQGGVSYPQMFGLAVGRYKLPSAFEPFSRVDFKLKASVNSTLTPDVTVMTMCDNGNIGAGTVLPTATMHLRAGTATAGTAPLKIDPGVVLTTPEAGAFEFTNAETGLTFTAVATRRQVLLDTATQTVSNKRVTKRVVVTTQSATPAINTDVTDVSSITALAQAITSFTMTGTPVDGDSLIIRITDNGTARAITWGTSFEASTTALPTTTVVSTMLTVGFIWNTVSSKWRIVAVA